MKCLCYIGLWLLLLPQAGLAQKFLNGSFESNRLDSCGINLNNELYSILVDYSIAFGDKNEVDLLSLNCGFGDAQEGDYFVALNSQRVNDAISLELEEALVPGKRYAFTFFEKHGQRNIPTGIQIGLSNDPKAFGELIYASEQVNNSWTENYVEFTASSPARYITARPNPVIDTWIFLDHFSRTCPRNVSLGPDTIACRLENFTLSLEGEFDSYRWQDQSRAPELEVNRPGLYWVEVMANDCTLRDSVLIQEYPYQCDCQLFIPNIFSPNADGINDDWKIYSPCQLVQFELHVFDRWGALLFQSRSPEAYWDGRRRGEALGAGTYLYTLRYRFEYQDQDQMESGTISILR